MTEEEATEKLEKSPLKLFQDSLREKLKEVEEIYRGTIIKEE